ncbi:MAG: cbb3-type cytochrome oxidase assembly protein CcoS [Gloeocapsa sp. DLM2.Bin57]|nr:MAG: cbb3-type cytochrome oxidase assembly protein CcoS [Gloeocapsa sp. DLM2.Bin57]
MRRFYLVVIGVLIIVSITLIVDESLGWLYPADVTPSPGLIAYNSDQLQGRNVYIKQGCVYCHTQQVRPLAIDAPYLYGTRPSLPNDYAYQTPHLMGTERQGPDLTNIGRKYPGEEGKIKLTQLIRNPRLILPAALMPSFDYLSEEQINQLVSYLQFNGSWKEAYDGPITEWTYNYLRDAPNLTEQAIASIDRATQNHISIPIIVTMTLVMICVFYAIWWSWRRGHFYDLEEPAIRMIHHDEGNN